MEGGEAAPVSDTAVDGVEENLTGTEQFPLPVAPYAIAGYSRRYCFHKAAEDCRR